MAEHNAWKIALILLTVVVFIVTITFNGLAGAAIDDVFKNSTGDVSNKFYLEITPAGWTFSIWGFIYAWQALWLLYSVSTICRRREDTYLYRMPYMPPVLFVVFILNNALNIGWLFAWDRQEIAVALPVLALQPFTLYICLFFSFKRLYENLSDMNKQHLSKDVWLTRLLVQNGIAFYAAWVTVATLLNLGVVMTYKDGSDITDIGVNQEDSSTTMLTIVLVELVVWFFIDIVVFDKYVRYTFSPYITLVVALAGVVDKNYDLDDSRRNSVFMAILLSLACFLLVLKLVIMFIRYFKKPIASYEEI